MNICLISAEYPPETGWGGIGTHIYELAHGLKKSGANVVVVARSVDKERVYDDRGVVVYRILPIQALQKRGIWRIQRLWDGYNLAVALKLRQIVGRHNIHIVEAPESRAEGFFALLTPGRTFPLVVKLHTGTYWNWIFNRRSFRLCDRWTILMEKYSVHHADLVISPSQALIELSRRSGGYLRHGQKAMVVRNPIDCSRFCGIDAGAPVGGRYVLFTGRLEERKGVRTLIEAMLKVWKKHPEVRLVLVGGDSGLGKSLVRVLPPDYQKLVDIIGFVPRDDIISYYRNAAICVFPSHWENFPYTCLEAMASGSAVVGSKNGGMSEMMEDGVSGFLVAPEESNVIAERIRLLLNDPLLREKMSENAARAIREKFDTPVVVKQTLEVYRKVIYDWNKKRKVTRHG